MWSWQQVFIKSIVTFNSDAFVYNPFEISVNSNLLFLTFQLSLCMFQIYNSNYLNHGLLVKLFVVSVSRHVLWHLFNYLSFEIKILELAYLCLQLYLTTRFFWTSLILFETILKLDYLCLQEPIPVTQLVRETTTVMQEFTQSGYAYYVVIICLFCGALIYWKCGHTLQLHDHSVIGLLLFNCSHKLTSWYILIVIYNILKLWLTAATMSLCSGVRPFGVSLLVAGYDDNGPQLYQVFMFSFCNILLQNDFIHFGSIN